MKELGWTWLRVEGRGTVRPYTGQGRVCDVVLRGHGTRDPVDELMKFDVGFTLGEGGRVEMFFADKSARYATSAYRGVAEELRRAVAKYANILRVLKALNLRPSAVQRSREKVVVRVTM